MSRHASARFWRGRLAEVAKDRYCTWTVEFRFRWFLFRVSAHPLSGSRHQQFMNSIKIPYAIRSAAGLDCTNAFQSTESELDNLAASKTTRNHIHHAKTWNCPTFLQLLFGRRQCPCCYSKRSWEQWDLHAPRSAVNPVCPIGQPVAGTGEQMWS